MQKPRPDRLCGGIPSLATQLSIPLSLAAARETHLPETRLATTRHTISHLRSCENQMRSETSPETVAVIRVENTIYVAVGLCQMNLLDIKI